MNDVLFLIGLAMFLAFVVSRARRSSAFAWALIPIFGSPFFFAAAAGWVELTPFGWVKPLSLLASLVAFNLFRFTRLGSHPLGGIVLWLLLTASILQSCLQDYFEDFQANAAVGVILVLTMGGPGRIRWSRDGLRDISWPLEASWVLTYTMWNFAFAARVDPTHVSDHFATLGVPLLFMLFRKHLWLQARGYVLTIYGLVVVTTTDAFHLGWGETLVPSSPLLVLGSTVAGAFLIPWVIFDVVRRRRAARRWTLSSPPASLSL